MSRPAGPEGRSANPAGGVAPGNGSPGPERGPVGTPELLREAQRAAADLLVFAPIGFAKRARSLLPDLIREGRSAASSAKTIGKIVTPIARKQGTKLVKAKVAELTRSSKATPAPSPPPAGETGERRPAGAANAKVKAATKNPPDASVPATVPATAQEPFPGYEHLGSAAVVARLGELSGAERAAVRAFETANRNRRTILGRLDQLDSSR